MKEIKNVYALVYTNQKYRNEKAVIYNVVSADFITAIKSHREHYGKMLGTDWSMTSVNMIAEDVDY